MSTHQASLTADSTDLRLTRAEVCRAAGGAPPARPRPGPAPAVARVRDRGGPAAGRPGLPGRPGAPRGAGPAGLLGRRGHRPGVRPAGHHPQRDPRRGPAGGPDGRPRGGRDHPHRAAAPRRPRRAAPRPLADQRGDVVRRCPAARGHAHRPEEADPGPDRRRLHGQPGGRRRHGRGRLVVRLGADLAAGAADHARQRGARDPGQGGGPGAHPRHAAPPARAGPRPVRRRQPPPRAGRGVRERTG